MRKITGQQTKYVKYSETAPNTTLVKSGKFSDIKQSKFGQTYIFSQDDGDIGINASGQLKYLVEKGKMILGKTYVIVYLGKKNLKDGKTSHDFDVFEDDAQLGLFQGDGETDELPEGLR